MLTKPRVAFILSQFVHVIVFAYFLGSGVNPTSLLTSGLACTVIYTLFLYSEFRRSRKKLSPFLFYLAASVFRLGIGTMYAVTLYAAGFNALLSVGVYDVSSYLMEGHWIAMIGDLAFIVGYCGYSSVTRKRDSRKKGKRFAVHSWRAYQAAMFFLLFSLFIRSVSSYISFGGFGLLLSYVQDYGPAAAIYVMLSVLAAKKSNVQSLPSVFTWLSILVNVVWSLFSYMKSDLFIALLPVILATIQNNFRGATKVNLRSMFAPFLLLLVAAYFFLYVVSAYSQLRRPDFWVTGGQAVSTYKLDIEVSSHLQKALLSSLPWTTENEELHKFPTSGVWNMVRRMSLITYPAWSYGHVKSVGTNPESFFGSVLVAITPRLLWPDKPQLSPGRDFEVTIGNARSYETATSATALTMQGAYYWWGGMLGLVIGCFATGLGFAIVWDLFAAEAMVNPISSLTMLALFYEGFHWFESAFLGSMPFYAYAVIVFLPLQLLLRNLIGYQRVNRRSEIHYRGDTIASS